MNIDDILRYYYQYDIERLPACTLTIHGLLHVVQGIRDCGPVWTTWTFHMERFCGMLQRELCSRSQPWSNLNKVLLHRTYLEQLKVRYDLTDELANEDDREDDGPIGYERVLDDCKCARSLYTMQTLELTLNRRPDPDHILRPPYERVYKLDQDLQERIARYFGQVLGKRSSEVKKRLPTVALFTAGKLRVRHGGDLFRTKQVSRRLGALERRNCYVRVSPPSLDTRYSG